MPHIGLSIRPIILDGVAAGVGGTAPLSPAQRRHGCRRAGTTVCRVIAGAIVIALGTPAFEAQQPADAGLVGGVRTYEVKPADTLGSIGARFGVDPSALAADNAMMVAERLAVGQRIVVDNRHIVPLLTDGVVLTINVPQRMLFHRGDAITGLPVAVGRRDWPTPLGISSVVSREENPTWDVPASIAAEAQRQGRTLPKSVPPGPANPLGTHWLGLSRGGIGLHGTNAPGSIYRATTHGCIRLHPDDVAWLFPRIELGATVEIGYEPVLLTESDGRIWLEVHADVYRRAPSAAAVVRARASALGLSARIDWGKASAVTERRHGVARDVTAEDGDRDPVHPVPR